MDDLIRAIDACEKLCHLRGYKIINMENRRRSEQYVDVVVVMLVN